MASAMIAIRDELHADEAAIARITALAFAGVELSDQSEPAIVAGLRDATALALSLVADDGGEVVGHLAFSPVKVDGRDCGWFGLGPVSVLPRRQGTGIGSTLILAGLDRLRALSAAGCVVLGDPEYYGRFGFKRDDRLRFDSAPPGYFLGLELSASKGPVCGGVEYHPAFFGG